MGQADVLRALYLCIVYHSQLVTSIKQRTAPGSQAAARTADVDISNTGLIETILRHEYQVCGGDDDEDCSIVLEEAKLTSSVNINSRQEAAVVLCSVVVSIWVCVFVVC